MILLPIISRILLLNFLFISYNYSYCFLSCARMASRPAVAMARFSVSLVSRTVGASGEVDESVGELTPSSQSMETPRATAIL